MVLCCSLEVAFRKMNKDNEQAVAALNTLIDLALSTARQHQAMVQNAANTVAAALGVIGEETPEGDGDAEPAAEEDDSKIILAKS